MNAFGTDNLLALTVQVAAVVAAGAPLPRLLGIRSPRARLAYWRVLLVACLLLPVLQRWEPRPPERPLAPAVVAEQVTPGRAGQASPPAPGSAAAWLPRVGLFDLLALGIAARAAWFLVGLGVLARLRRRATRLEPRPGPVVDAIGLARADAEFRVAPTPSRPVTFGFVRPVVVVPSDFAAFGEDEQTAIACHELIHVRRRDWVRNLGDELVRAVAWFHPAAWWLTRQIRLAREEVVDQEVVRQMGARKPYLDALLRLASPDRGSLFVPAPLFLGRSHLSDRIALLLKEVRMSRLRLALSFVAMAAVLFATGRAVAEAFPLQVPQKQAVGAARPGQVTRQPASPAKKSSPPSRLKGALPAFPSGSAAGPVIVKGSIAAGSVTEAACVAGPADLCDVAVAAVRQWKFTPESGTSLLVGFNPAAASGALASQPPVLVGGNVRPPVKVLDKKPVYPAEAQEAHVQGVVILETGIAADGQVSDARILRSIPQLNMAALEAVLGWKFQPRGFPMQMTVTVNFLLDGGPAGVPGGVKGGVAGGVKGGVKGGVPGGITGGVAGGVAGGVQGGVPLAGAEGAVRVGGNIKAPQKVVDVKPVYPTEAREARVQGVVIIEAVIGPDGKVKDAKILRSVPQLDEAALEAVRQWEFTQTIVEGKPVSVIMTVTVNFRLQ